MKTPDSLMYKVLRFYVDNTGNVNNNNSWAAQVKVFLWKITDVTNIQIEKVYKRIVDQ